MTRNRRVGTLTLGLALLGFGILFLLQPSVPAITYEFILSLWPVVLILLGVEVCVAYIVNRSEKFIYDWASFVIIFILGIFSFTMACMTVVLDYIRLYA